MPKPRKFALLQVDIVIYPGFKLLEAVGPLTVFSYANTHLLEQGKEPAYEIRVVAPKKGSVCSDTMLSLEAGYALDDTSLADTVMLVGAHQIEEILQRSTGIVDWARNVSPQVRRFAALCSGSFFLAACGALSGKRATTHWRVADLLRKLYPSVEVDSDSIFIQQDNLWTSAGVSAGIDLALAFVEQDCGRDLALQIARDLVIFLKRPGGQSQFSTDLTSQMTLSPTMRETQRWILENLEKKISVPQLAQLNAMSVRNFSRIFHRETQSSPVDFIEKARLGKARRLLEDSQLPLKTISFLCGFASDDQLRKSFQKHLSTRPKDYRERFATARQL